MTIGTRQFEAFYKADNPTTDSARLICTSWLMYEMKIRTIALGVTSFINFSFGQGFVMELGETFPNWVTVLSEMNRPYFIVDVSEFKTLFWFLEINWVLIAANRNIFRNIVNIYLKTKLIINQ